MTRRKDALAGELMREIAPVVGGVGRRRGPHAARLGRRSSTRIEIQDVRVMSSGRCSRNMQARFRQELEQKAREAELSRDRAVQQDEASTERQIELARVASQTEVRRQKQAAEEAARLEKLAGDARVEDTQLLQAREAELKRLAIEAELTAQKRRRTSAPVGAARGGDPARAGEGGGGRAGEAQRDGGRSAARRGAGRGRGGPA